MRIVGSVIGARCGRLGLLAGLVIALTALLSVSASDAAIARAKGLDVSNWNGAINWTKVAHAGYRFTFAKATEGTVYLDKTYTTNRNGSEGAGLVYTAAALASIALDIARWEEVEDGKGRLDWMLIPKQLEDSEK